MLISLIIIIFILMGGALGMKRGAIKELVTVIGFIVIFVLAYLFKNPLANLFYEYLPFFKFDGLTSLNILFYEALSFIILISLFGILLRVLISLSGAIEKFLDATIILGIPSKLIGCLLGILEYVGITFIILYFITVKYDVRSNSKVAEIILNETPVLSSMCDKSLNTINEINDIKDQYKDKEDKSLLNQQIVEIMIKNNVITREKIDELIEKDKLKM